MKFLNGKCYVEVMDKRYRIYPTENIILGEGDPTKSPRTRYEIRNDTQIRQTEKGIRNINGELIVKKIPRNKQ